MRTRPEDRPIIHCVPRYTDDGQRDGVTWVRTMTEAKSLAKEQARRLGHGAYSIMSLSFQNVADLLEGLEP